MPFHDEAVGRSNRFEFGVGINGEYRTIIKRTATLQNCSTSRAASKNGGVRFTAQMFIHLILQPFGITENNEVRFALPEAQKSWMIGILLAKLEECLITGQLFGRIRIAAIENLHLPGH